MKVTKDRLRKSLIDRDWEDIERDLLPPHKRLENLKTQKDGSFMVHVFPMDVVKKAAKIPPAKPTF